MSFTEDFSSGEIPAAYFDIDASGDSTVTVEDGRVRLTAVSEDEASIVNTRLQLIGRTDFFQAEVMVSSDTIATGVGRSRIQMAGILYNDTAEGGVDGFTGDVWGGISLGKDKDDSVWVFACLERSDDAVFDASSSLLFNEAGNECVHLEDEIQPDYDKPVTMSMALDREAGKVLFTVDDQVIEYIINTPIYTSANESKEIKARREEGAGTSIVYADNIRAELLVEDSSDGTDSDSAVDSGSDSLSSGDSDDSQSNSEDDSGSDGGGAAGWWLLAAGLAYRRVRRA
ncbi:hypothetical protein Q4485_03400 [Granulosicoccaceae sp. 1_MG-2023]|nr:hypothetical protein [Granulosicoccaceae sp. 1_MG-2023]